MYARRCGGRGGGGGSPEVRGHATRCLDQKRELERWSFARSGDRWPWARNSDEGFLVGEAFHSMNVVLIAV